MSARNAEIAVRTLRETGYLRLRGRRLRAVASTACLVMFVVVLAALSVMELPHAWPPGVSTVRALGAGGGAVGAALLATITLRRTLRSGSAIVIDPGRLSILGHHVPWSAVRAATMIATPGPESTTVMRSAVALTPTGAATVRHAPRRSRIGLEFNGDDLLLPPIAGLSPREVVAVLHAAVTEHRMPTHRRG